MCVLRNLFRNEFVFSGFVSFVVQSINPNLALELVAVKALRAPSIRRASHWAGGGRPTPLELAG